MSSQKDLGEPTLPPCRVCGRRASGLHFGVITCEACKAFYKRSRGRQRPFMCRGKEAGKCVIKNGKLPLCSFCRLQECLKAGMCREGINKGRCPIEKKTELLLEARAHQQEVMRQMVLNEKRGLEQNQKSPSSVVKTSSNPMNGEVTTKTTSDKDSETLQTLNIHPNHVTLQTSRKVISNGTNHPVIESLLDAHVILNNPLTTEAMLEATTPKMPAQNGTRQLFDEFMSLVMKDDSLLESDPIGILNATTDTQSSFSGQRLMEIVIWLDSVLQADIETELFDRDETEQAVINNAAYKARKAATVELIGPLKPLSHEIYTEVYNATGIDVDNYRLRPSTCLADADQDIRTYIEFLQRVPIFAEHDLNDKLRITKGGFTGWILLSSLEMFDGEGDCMSCGTNIVWTGDDFVSHFGPAFEGVLQKSFEVFKRVALTQEELAVLKLDIIYRERSYLEPKGSGHKIKEQQDLIQDALVYLFESNRGKEKGIETLKEVQEAMDITEKICTAVWSSIRNWPHKFPEFHYPQIWLEMACLVPEEELIVAVSTNLNIRD